MSTSRPTIHDVASLAGTSKSLVSLALSGSPKVSARSKERIIQAAEQLGYRPNATARSLVAQRTRTIGVLILDLHNPVFAEILDGVQTEMRKHGFSTMLVSGGDDPTREQAEIDTLLQFRVEGLILISHRLTETALRDIARDVPTVIVTRSDMVPANTDTVRNDDVAGTGLAIDYLVELGHKDIVFLSGGDNPVSIDRARGYREAMDRHGLGEGARIVHGGSTDAGGYAAAVEALKLSPTALVVFNDIAALGAIAAIKDAGLSVPEDISVIGYDGMSLGSLRSVNLTSVAQPLGELGALAAQRLIGRIEKPSTPPQQISVTSTLAIRGTAGPVTPR